MGEYAFLDDHPVMKGGRYPMVFGPYDLGASRGENHQIERGSIAVAIDRIQCGDILIQGLQEIAAESHIARGFTRKDLGTKRPVVGA